MRAILTYHSIDESGSPVSISEGAFRRHVKWLASGAVRVVSVDEVVASSGNAVAVTFDDAFVNFATVAWPLLHEHGLPVTLYVPTAHVGGSNDWGGRTQPGIPRLSLLSWDDLGRLAEQGVTLGSHTRTHPRLGSLRGSALYEELEGSAHDLRQHAGVTPRGLAYPYGSYDEAVVQAATRCYDHACSVELRPLRRTEPRHALPRLDAYYLRGEGLIEPWGTGRQKLYLRARAGARRCRSLLEKLQA